MITKAQVELAKAHLWPRDDTTEWQSPELHDALSALIAVGEKLADQTHVMVLTDEWVQMHENELWEAYRVGIERDGEWWNGAMSDAEWLANIAEIYSDRANADALKAKIPALAIERAMIAAAK